jgi:hypothetical protein
VAPCDGGAFAGGLICLPAAAYVPARGGVCLPAAAARMCAFARGAYVHQKQNARIKWYTWEGGWRKGGIKWHTCLVGSGGTLCGAVVVKGEGGGGGLGWGNQVVHCSGVT